MRVRVVPLAALALAAGGCMFTTGGGQGGWVDQGDAAPDERDLEPADAAPEGPEGEPDVPLPDDPIGPPPDDPPPDDPPPDGPPPDDPPPDDPPPPVCTYPAGPYAFGMRAVVPPMSWPAAVAGPAESGVADLEELFCEPEVRSVFVFVGNDT